jgi:hypothetical protein
MKIEKKLIAISILAIAIGIATVIPMTHFMNANAQTYDTPWFNIEVPYAYFKADLTGNIYQDIYLMPLQTSINYKTYNPQTDGRIEYLELTFYTDDLQLFKGTYFISASNSDKDPSDMLVFAREDWFNSTDFDLNHGGSGVCINSTNQMPQIGGIFCKGITSGDDVDWLNKRFGDLLTVLENTQTIYFDVTRIGYVTFDGSNTVVTLAGNQVIQHIELTKKNNAFIFGELEDIERQLAIRYF